MKRIATMQDISCVGKCSLTVALPIISAMGVEAAVIPTAVLSTHTAFKGFTFHDLTGEIEPITAHWKKEGFAFDALYTGYLGSFEQLKLAEKLFKDFRTDRTIVLVDPCMQITETCIRDSPGSLQQAWQNSADMRISLCRT